MWKSSPLIDPTSSLTSTTTASLFYPLGGICSLIRTKRTDSVSTRRSKQKQNAKSTRSNKRQDAKMKCPLTGSLTSPRARLFLNSRLTSTQQVRLRIQARSDSLITTNTTTHKYQRASIFQSLRLMRKTSREVTMRSANSKPRPSTTPTRSLGCTIKSISGTSTKFTASSTQTRSMKRASIKLIEEATLPSCSSSSSLNKSWTTIKTKDTPSRNT